MTHSETIGNIMQAIQNVQQSVGIIRKESTADTGKYKYRYANLTQTWESISGTLKTNGLVITQSASAEHGNGSGHYFTTLIFHLPSGEWLREVMPMIFSRDDPQGIGSAITYYRRYMLTSLLGLIADDDTDAREHRLATAEQKRRLVGAVKLAYPELNDSKHIIDTLMNILGKHPSHIREDEAEDMINLVKSFTATEAAK